VTTSPSANNRADAHDTGGSDSLAAGVYELIDTGVSEFRCGGRAALLRGGIR
jgi:hypothetical protein